MDKANLAYRANSQICITKCEKIGRKIGEKLLGQARKSRCNQLKIK
jgi:hypothetical protein